AHSNDVIVKRDVHAHEPASSLEQTESLHFSPLDFYREPYDDLFGENEIDPQRIGWLALDGRVYDSVVQDLAGRRPTELELLSARVAVLKTLTSVAMDIRLNSDLTDETLFSALANLKEVETVFRSSTFIWRLFGWMVNGDRAKFEALR